MTNTTPRFSQSSLQTTACQVIYLHNLLSVDYLMRVRQEGFDRFFSSFNVMRNCHYFIVVTRKKYLSAYASIQ